jgi:uncharacterized membrane protein YcaP (DUF421 family)
MPDWGELFGLSVSPWELMVRGTAIYWLLVIIFRVVLRPTGAVGIADVLLLVVIADAAQNAMAGEYRSITDGAILILTIIGWNIFIDWLTYVSPTMRRILEPRALPLVRNGQLLRQNMRKELIAEPELMSKLREHGVDDVKDVKVAYIESDGRISVVEKKKK